MSALLEDSPGGRQRQDASRSLPPLRRGGRCAGGGRQCLMWLGFALAALIAVADQLTKLWVLGFFAGRGGPPMLTIAPFFNLVLTGNRGMSFGLFNNDAAANTAIFTA